MAIQEGTPDRVTRGYLEERTILGEHSRYFDVIPDADYQHPLPPDHLTIAEMGEPFDLQGFERPRIPTVVGHGDLNEVPLIDVHNVPLKFPGTEYRVPSELSYVRDILKTCVSVEKSINPHHDESYAYLSLERSWVNQGDAQRTPRIHTDGLQGARIQPKVPAEHAYQVVDSQPARFFIHPFDMTGIDVDKHNMDVVFTQQARQEETVTFAPGEIVLFDSYNLHQAQRISIGGLRTFLRLTYAHKTRQFDRIGNTVNAHFEKEYASEGWKFQPRPKADLPSPDVDNR